MNYKDYVNQISKKLKLAVVIAVIKNKPEDLTTEQYIDHIKEKINLRTNDDEDLICSDDFEYNDNVFNTDDITEINTNLDRTSHLAHMNDDISLFVDVTDTQIDKTASINILQEFNDKGVSEVGADVDPRAVKTSHLDHMNDDMSLFVDVTDTQIDETASVNILQEFNDKAVLEVGADVDPGAVKAVTDASKMNSLNEVLKSIRDIDQNIMEVDENLVQYETQTDILENSQLITSFNANLSNVVEQNLPALKPFTDFDFINRETQNSLFIDERLKATVAKNIAKQINSTENRKNSAEKTVLISKKHTKLDICKELNKDLDINTDFVKAKTERVINNVLIEINKKQNEMKQPHVIQETNTATLNDLDRMLCDTQATVLYTLHGYTENTQISQSQSQNIHIANNFIIGNKNQMKNDFKNALNENKKNNSENSARENVYVNEEQPEMLNIDSKPIQYFIDENGRTYTVISTLPLNNSENRTENINGIEPIDIRPADVTNENITKEIDNSDNISKNLENSNNVELEDEIDYLDSQDRIVPFKVIKELSKIKAFLHKRERRGSIDGSSDSGYRSDSQSSFKNAYQSETWMHQSAYSLYSYITQCPLVAVTQEMITEISQVLGKLIDKLHEEENYPNFLEELLEKVTNLLNDLYEESDDSEDVLLEKDEIIQRIILLNKSAHILKFTIEKVTAILENAYAHTSQNQEFSEITNIRKLENLNYIFHLLEILIRKFKKVKNNINLSQNTQNSQEAKILKKSSISEIWRKKWNSNFKEVKNVGSQEKSCVLIKCGVVLNKLIVGCMEEYSLISFAALQCFNLLQN